MYLANPGWVLGLVHVVSWAVIYLRAEENTALSQPTLSTQLRPIDARLFFGYFNLLAPLMRSSRFIAPRHWKTATHGLLASGMLAMLSKSRSCS